MNITTGIYSIYKIEREAKEAAMKYSNPDDCCPYPADSVAAGVFRHAFLMTLAERCALKQHHALVEKFGDPAQATDWNAA